MSGWHAHNDNNIEYSYFIFWCHKDISSDKPIQRSEVCLLLFFYELLTKSTLATRRTGEQKFSCLQFASSAHNVASEVMETCSSCINSALIQMIL